MGIFSFIRKITNPIKAIGEKITSPIKQIGDKIGGVVKNIGEKTIGRIIPDALNPLNLARKIFDLKRKFQNLPWVSPLLEVARKIPIVGKTLEGFDKMEAIIKNIQDGKWGEVGQQIAESGIEQTIMNKLPPNIQSAIRNARKVASGMSMIEKRIQ